MISPAPIPTPATATAIGRPIASTEPNETDQHDDRERDADELRLGRRELRKRRAADLDLQAGQLRREVGELDPELRGWP